MTNKIILPYEILDIIFSYRGVHPTAKLIKEYIPMYNYTELKNRIDADQYDKYYTVLNFYEYWSRTKNFYRLSYTPIPSEYKHKFTIPPSFDVSYESHLIYAESRKITLSQLACEHWKKFYQKGLSIELIKSN